MTFFSHDIAPNAKSINMKTEWLEQILDCAQKLGMRAVRTRTVGGEQRAVVRPAPFLAAAGDAYPGTVGGQTLLAGL